MSPGKYTGIVLKPKKEGVETLWLNKYLCHLVTGIYIFRWPNNAVRDMSKIFLDLNAYKRCIAKILMLMKDLGCD